METIEDLEDFLQSNLRDVNRNRLGSLGIAWSIMRVNGAYEGSTAFSPTIDTDLFEYSLSLLRASLELKDRNGNKKLIQDGFERAGRTLEALLTNPKPDDIDLGFIRVMAACCYHLAGYSAIAFSILHNQTTINSDNNDANNNATENAIRFLILRDLRGLRDFVANQLNDNGSSDESISGALASGESAYDDVVVKISNLSICRALAFFEFALQTGSSSHVEVAKSILKKVISITNHGAYVTLWWMARLALHLLDDLWEHSLHQVLPTEGPGGGESLYPQLRRKFILTLFVRDASEVEVWPSQIEAAQRSTDPDDDLVVALPTSAGKTRIAEIAALIALSAQKRIVIVTPLRALSAQTERSFKRTFVPLGYSVSSLYGAAGMSSNDQDALKDKSIVIATPEKLDFALRNDASVFDDVGLLILDEGHMVGKSEREIRYELLVQRLLRRSDAKNRRIVCLSAILPDGDQLNNFTQWLRGDEPGSPVKSKWRPTRQRFGVLTWQGEDATLNFDHKDDIPFIRKFSTLSPAKGRAKKPRPRDLSEKTIFAAWQFARQGKRTLIFITTAGWVEGYGTNAIDLVNRGYLESLLENPNDIQQAVNVGEEWLGKNHPAVKALEIGMAVHHAGLPKPFLRELEMLLSKGVIKVTAASPTLSQGLNINAAVLLVPYLSRAGKRIEAEEFANVAGRAGRAFVDVEGFVIHIIEDKVKSRRAEWTELIQTARVRNLASGLFQVIEAVYEKLSFSNDMNKDSSFEYLAGNRDAWFPDVPLVTGNEHDEMNSIESLIEKLDATVFGLIGALESGAEHLPRLLDEALKGSLWERQVSLMSDRIKRVHMRLLVARAKLIWSDTTPAQRRGHFAAGVGFDTGLAIDKDAEKLEALLDTANEAAVTGDVSSLADALIKLAEKLLLLRPFVPKALPNDWKAVLKKWVAGKDVEEIGTHWIPFIDEVFSYKMVWALEAVRMRRIAHGWEPDSASGGASACLENGVPQHMMAMLIRAGLSSRIAAIKAVVDGEADFKDGIGMSIWLGRKKVRALHKDEAWPTPITRQIWVQFYLDFFSGVSAEWALEEKSISIKSNQLGAVADGEYRVRVIGNEATLYTPDFKRVLSTTIDFSLPHGGVLSARLNRAEKTISIERFGPGKFGDSKRA